MESTLNSVREMAIGRRIGLTLLVLGLACGTAAAENAAPTGLAALLAQLETGTFAERTSAEAQLFELGKDAIPELQTAAKTGSPELSMRIVRVLRRIYLSDQGPTGDAAETALETLARNDAVAAADVALDTIEVDRETRAIKAIETLGGKVRLEEGRYEGRAELEIRLEEGWKGGEEGLKYFSRIRPERRMMVTVIDGCGVSSKAAHQLQTDHPWLTIQERGAATLGIGPDPFPGRVGCVIGNVLPDNAAHKAGVLVGDRIVKANDREIENFNGLVEYLRSRKVGEEVTLEVERDGEPVELTAKLQSWKSIDDALPNSTLRRQPPPAFIVPPTPIPLSPPKAIPDGPSLPRRSDPSK